ncbi:MAG: hypothetical protein VW455_04755 [Nitrospinota bacterium]
MLSKLKKWDLLKIQPEKTFLEEVNCTLPLLQTPEVKRYKAKDHIEIK